MLPTQLASLSQHVASQKTAIHDLEARLSAAQSDMRKAQQRADKAGEEAELLRVSQRRMEGEIVLIASQTSTVFGTSERQLEQVHLPPPPFVTALLLLIHASESCFPHCFGRGTGEISVPCYEWVTFRRRH